MKSISPQDLLELAAACESAATAESVQAERAAVLEVVALNHHIQVRQMQAHMRSLSQVPHAHERLPLRCEGDDFGYVESRMPKNVFFHFLKQKNVGHAGLCDDGFQRDLLRDHPAFKVKTVSGKTSVGWRAPRPRRGVTFARGTLTLAP